MNEQTCLSFREIIEGEAKEPVSTGTSQPKRKAGRRKKETVVNYCLYCGKPTSHRYYKHCSKLCHARVRFTASQKDNFYKKFTVNKETGCWEWFTSLNKKGYGNFSLYEEGKMRTVKNRITDFAHRASWILHNGEIPEGLLVCHRCDNRRCVNPEHLFLGTQKDNLQDMYKKGRGIVGSKSCKAKLNEEKVIEIRRLAGSGMPRAKVGEMFGVKRQAIDGIINKQDWKHVI